MADLKASRVLIIATDGFEHDELFVPRQALLDAGAEVTLASIKTDPIQGVKNDSDPTETITPDLTLDQVDAHEATHRDAVDDGIFNSFVRQAQAVLAQIHAQHRFQPDRRTTALAAVVVRLDQCHQLRPRHQTIQVGQKLLPPRRLAARRVLEIGEAGLLFHREG